MRRLIAFLAFFALFLTSAVHIFAQDRPNLIELLQNDSDARFTTLLSAIDAAGLSDALAGEGPYTLLAPTNDAFAAAFATLGMTQEQVFADADAVTQIVRYHVIPGRYFFRDLTGGPTLATALAGQRVTFDLTRGVFTVQGANLSDPDNIASNGIMHIIDAVILPPDVQALIPIPTPEPTAEVTAEPTPEATVEPTVEPTPEPTAVAGAPAERPDLITLLQNDPNGRFSTLLALIAGSEAGNLLSGAGPFTLLAPTNDAFAALLAQTGMTQDDLLADRATLTKILLDHVLRGEYFFRDLTSGPTLPTSLLGQSVTFNLTRGVFTVQGANISDPDNLASNGIMHIIDAVIVPPDVQAQIATPEPTPEPTVEPTVEPTPEPTAVAGAPAERPDLITLLQNDPNGRFSTLLALIAGSEAGNLLSGAGPFTLLAPTNDAFAALLAQTGMTQDDLLADRATLTKILLDHVLRGEYFFRDLTAGPTLPTSLLGQSVTFNLTRGVFTVQGANISDPDNLASNGIMHIIDAVIVPPDVQAQIATPEPTPEPTVEPTVEPTPEPTAVAGAPAERPDLITLLQNDPDGRFSTLLAAIAAAGLTDTLNSGGPFTLLAPTNDAFAAVLATLGVTPEQALANSSLLSQVVLYHVVPGRYFFRDLTSGPTLPSLLSGQSVTFDLTAGVFTAGGANISDPDNIASNGVMHVVDSLLLPPAVQALIPTPTPEPTPEITPEPTTVAPPERPSLLELLEGDANGQFTTLLSALDAAGLTDALAGDGPYTLLAPTNDAFAALLDQTNLTADQLMADTDTLAEILRYHIIPGRYFFRDLTSGPTLATALAGERVTFDLTRGVFTVQGANLSDPDNIASNGVMHVIEAVIVPPELQTALTSNPRLRVAHFSTDAGPVDIYINGELSSLANVLFPTVSPWMNLSPGTYEIGIAPAGSDPTTTVSVDLAPNDRATVVAVGAQARSALRAYVIREDYTPLPEGTARLSLFNSVEGTSYNVIVGEDTVVIRLGYPRSQGGNDGFFSADVPAGTYLVQFVVASQTSTVAINLPDVTLDAGNSYWIAAAGSPDAPGAVIVPSVVPAAQAQPTT